MSKCSSHAEAGAAGATGAAGSCVGTDTETGLDTDASARPHAGGLRTACEARAACCFIAHAWPHAGAGGGSSDAGGGAGRLASGVKERLTPLHLAGFGPGGLGGTGADLGGAGLRSPKSFLRSLTLAIAPESRGEAPAVGARTRCSLGLATRLREACSLACGKKSRGPARGPVKKVEGMDFNSFLAPMVLKPGCKDRAAKV